MLHCNQQMPNEVYLYLVRTTICRTTLNIETEQVAILDAAGSAVSETNSPLNNGQDKSVRRTEGA